jgi:hydroxyacid-oxoacid transhydrogenase
LRQQAASSGNALEKEYAFEMSVSNIRYGLGVTQEVGMDIQNLGIKKLAVFTDKNVRIEILPVLC